MLYGLQASVRALQNNISAPCPPFAYNYCQLYIEVPLFRILLFSGFSCIVLCEVISELASQHKVTFVLFLQCKK